MRVLHLIGSLDVGGAERVALDLCRRLPRAKVEQTFLCLSGRPGTLAGEFVEAGATVETLPMRPVHSLPWRFVSSLNQVRPDSFVSHVSLASGPFLLLARLRGVRQRIGRFHNNADDHGVAIPRRVYRSLMRACVYAGATHVLGVTDAATEFGLGRLSARSRRTRMVDTLSNGVDTSRFAPPNEPPDPSRLTIVHIGRSAAQKNRQALPGIFDAVVSRRPAVLRVVGTWETADIGPGADRLDIVGPITDVRPLLHQSHVSILPSRWEGLPGVVLESLSCGVPVVATDLPGLRDIAQYCEGVTLVPIDAPVDRWADAVISAADTAATRRTAIRDSFVKSPFSLEENAERWYSIWLTARGTRRADTV